MTVSLNHLVMQGGGAAKPADRSGRATSPTPFERHMASLYADVDRAIAARDPVCTNRGHCCRFGEYGHRLFVTDVELQYFLSGVDRTAPSPGEDRCPYQLGGICTARDRRPLGCRVFFCDPNAQSWQPALYESGLRKLRDIGGRFGIGYRYREWLSALAFPDGSSR